MYGTAKLWEPALLSGMKTMSRKTWPGFDRLHPAGQASLVRWIVKLRQGVN